MLIAMLNNVCTPINLVNGARYQVIDIILDENNISNFW